MGMMQIASAILFPINGAQLVATGKALEWARVSLETTYHVICGSSDTLEICASLVLQVSMVCALYMNSHFHLSKHDLN